jgi:hypothetical protein
LNSILAQYSHIVGSHERLGITFNSDLELNEDFGKRSAGQRKRNDIVIMLSLFELIRQRGRFRADFVMLDEVCSVHVMGKGEKKLGRGFWVGQKRNGIATMPSLFDQRMDFVILGGQKRSHFKVHT